MQAWTISLDYLQGSSYLDDAPFIAKIFDKTTKLRFRDSSRAHYIKFGTPKDKDPRVGIRSGQIRLNGWVQIGHVPTVYLY
jgi:hypothetical protein